MKLNEYGHIYSCMCSKENVSPKFNFLLLKFIPKIAKYANFIQQKPKTYNLAGKGQNMQFFTEYNLNMLFIGFRVLHLEYYLRLVSFQCFLLCRNCASGSTFIFKFLFAELL